MIKFFYLLCVIIGVHAQELSTTIFQHYPEFTKLVLRDAESLKLEQYTIAIVYKPDVDESEENAKNVEPLIKSECEKLSKILSIPVKYVKIPYRSKGQFYVETDNSKVNIMYVCSEFEDEDIPRIAFVSENLGILTFTGSEDLFDEGLTATVKLEDDQPVLFIRQDQLKKERTNLSPDTFTDISQFENR